MQTLMDKLVASISTATEDDLASIPDALAGQWRMLSALLGLQQAQGWTPVLGTVLSAANRTCTAALVGRLSCLPARLCHLESTPPLSAAIAACYEPLARLTAPRQIHDLSLSHLPHLDRVLPGPTALPPLAQFEGMPKIRWGVTAMSSPHNGWSITIACRVGNLARSFHQPYCMSSPAWRVTTVQA